MDLADGDLVKEQSTPSVHVILGGGLLHVPSPEEFAAMGYDWAKVKVVPDGTLAGVSRVPVEGTLLKERSLPEVYVIRRRRRFHIPSEYTLLALGHQWSGVRTAPNGSLSHIPVDVWPSASPTPGSVVCLPYGTVWYPLRVPGTKRHQAWGREVRTIELRGWLSSIAEDCNAADPDWAYDLFLDSGWAIEAGLDLSSIIKLGNILQLGSKQPGATERAWISEPQIHMEVSGWPPKSDPPKEQKDRGRPPDWVSHSSVNCPGTVPWPFLCTHPRPADPPLRAGQYIRVVGSIISDKPHQDPADEHLWLQKVWFRNSNFEDELTRWTEIHPPDTIDVLAEARPRTETFRAVAVAAPGTFTGRPRPETVLEVEIPAPPRPPGRVTLQVQEIVGPETDPSTILEGNTDRSGARLTALPDGVAVFLRVGGKKSLFGGSPGKFRALYRVFWAPTGPAAEGDDMQPGEVLSPGDSIISANGRYTFVYQGDGNLVLYRAGTWLWDSETNGRPVGVCIMQGDGNLVIYGPDGNYIWDTATNGNPGSRLVVQPDGNVVIYRPDGTPVWATNTVQLSVVPNVMGVPRTQAETTIRAADLAPQFTGSNDPSARVASQSPRDGHRVPLGSPVTLELSTADLVVVPSVVGLSREEANEAVTGAGLVPAFTGSGFEVATQSPRAGTSAPRGSRVTLGLVREPRLQADRDEEGPPTL